MLVKEVKFMFYEVRERRRKIYNWLGLFVCGLILAVIGIVSAIAENYTWTRDYYSFWSLADKASSIPAKQQKLEEFYKCLVNGRERGVFASNNAKFLITPDNSFDTNLQALKTLVDRLEEIKQMDPTSFQYNTAIQQITAQEQGEAKAMLGVFEGCYALVNYPIAWEWFGGIFWTFVVVLLLVSCIGFIVALDHY
jgi:hypothetical protein